MTNLPPKDTNNNNDPKNKTEDDKNATPAEGSDISDDEDDPVLAKLRALGGQAGPARSDDDKERDEERAHLLASLNKASAALAKSRQDGAALRQQVTDLQKSFTRAENKMKEDVEFALSKFLKELFPVVDTIDRGLNAITKEERASNASLEKMATGFEGVRLQLGQVFNRFGVKEINPMGEEFDASKHEVIITQEKTGVEPCTVIQVVEKGYELKGRIIRPAKVIITPDM